MKLNDFVKSHPGFNTAFGVVFAIIAGLLLLGYLSRAARGGDGGPILEIPVASRDIAMGAAISEEMVTTRKTARDYVVPGTIRKRSEIRGSRALRFIGRGEPFTDYSLSGRGKSTLASRIPADLRAYSLRVRSSGAGDEMRAGDRVDVISTTSDPPKTTTLLRERFVLRVSGGSNASGDGDTSGAGYVSITLLVSPPEAELLAQAECLAEISLSLCPVTPVDSSR